MSEQTRLGHRVLLALALRLAASKNNFNRAAWQGAPSIISLRLLRTEYSHPTHQGQEPIDALDTRCLQSQTNNVSSVFSFEVEFQTTPDSRIACVVHMCQTRPYNAVHDM